MRRYWRSNVVLVAVVGLIGLSLSAGSAVGDPGTVVDFNNDLNGAAEEPDADLDGKGRAKVRLDLEAGEVCFDVQFNDTGTPNRGHIHAGPANVNGPILVTFFELRIPPAVPGAPASDPRNDALEMGRLEGCVAADPALLADMAAHPADYYVNLHNARFPGGAVRCQLED